MILPFDPSIHKLKPRSHQTEEAFRRFEHLMALAAEGSIVYDPKELNLEATTFVQYFREARVGFLKHGYQSTLIKSPVQSISLHILESGSVLLKNPAKDSQNKKASQPRDEAPSPFLPLDIDWKDKPACNSCVNRLLHDKEFRTCRVYRFFAQPSMLEEVMQSLKERLGSIEGIQIKLSTKGYVGVFSEQ